MVATGGLAPRHLRALSETIQEVDELLTLQGPEHPLPPQPSLMNPASAPRWPRAGDDRWPWPPRPARVEPAELFEDGPGAVLARTGPGDLEMRVDPEAYMFWPGDDYLAGRGPGSGPGSLERPDGRSRSWARWSAAAGRVRLFAGCCP